MIKLCACGNPIPKSINVDGKHKRVKNRSRCLECSPFQNSVYRKKSPEEKRTVAAEKARRWYASHRDANGVDPIAFLRTARKALVLALVNSQCQICGYKKCQRNLTFHHLRDKAADPSSRMFQRSLEKVVTELVKCAIVCHNCHGEIHDGLIDENRVNEAHMHFVEKLRTLQPSQWTAACLKVE